MYIRPAATPKQPSDNGIPTRRVKLICFTLTGGLCGLIAALLFGWIAIAPYNTGNGFELRVIAAVVLGGTGLFGGRGTVFGTFIGALLLAMLANGLILLGVRTFWDGVVSGVIIVVAAAFDLLARRSAEAQLFTAMPIDPAPVPYIQARGLSKSFGHVRALEKIDVEIREREVLAIVGDNGAGKSTLTKILSGVHRPDAGEILVDGCQVEIGDPRRALELGISTVFQNLALVDCRDVAANLFLGREPTRWGFFVDRRKMRGTPRRSCPASPCTCPPSNRRSADSRVASANPSLSDGLRRAQPHHYHGRTDCGSGHP